MFHPVKDGTIYEIDDNAFGFKFRCWVPPIGYGVNVLTGELQETDILKRDENPEEQHWERQPLPKWWAERRRMEKERQRFDRYYVDEHCEKFRSQEWRRRLCGVWFWNYNPKTKESELQYITGQHYLYVNYWRFQGKHMDFRFTDMRIWYCLAYCDTDPDSLGLIYITKRKLGKTALSGCWAYERTSRPPSNQHCGIQSKDDPSASEVFAKAIYQPWQRLPDFFRPIYDTMKGESELRFFHSSRKGASALEEREEEDALESWIDYGPASEGYYDGPELDTYISDEAGKVEKKISIRTRQDTVRYCSEIDGVMKGKQLYTTTVEVEETTADDHEFQELVYDSNPLKRNENNRTTTGMYVIFIPAHHGFYFDKYGYADEERAATFLLNTWNALQSEGKLRQLASAKRKNPMTIQQAFSADGESSLYNPILLQEQLDRLSWGDSFTERGDLVWKDGKEFWIEKKDENGNLVLDEKENVILIPNTIEWVDNPNGRFEKAKGWLPRNSNSVYERNGMLHPNQNYAFRGGCDPFRYDKTKDKRRSNCAAFIYQMEDIAQNQQFNNTFVLRYLFRAESTKSANMDILKMSWWCGCQMLFERNVNHWKEHFAQWKCNAFLMWMPNEVEPGIYTGGSGAGALIQTLCNYTEAYINEHIKKVYFKTLIDKRTNGWMGFKVDDTQKFDEPMAAGITLIAVKGKKYKLPNQQSRNIEDILPYRKAS
jgi:hypothetical protein